MLVSKRGVTLDQGYNLGMRSEESDTSNKKSVYKVSSNPSGFSCYSKTEHSEKEGNPSRSTESAKRQGKRVGKARCQAHQRVPMRYHEYDHSLYSLIELMSINQERA